MKLPELGDKVPQRKRGWQSWLAASLLDLAGWRIEGPFPNVPQAVVIAAPHTSNWDFILAILVLAAVSLRLSWMGKHTLFRWPFGGLFRRLGGIPIDRRQSAGVVEATVRAFSENPRLLIGLAPEGTRARVERWRSGFYHMAEQSEVPIVPISVDFEERLVRIGQPLVATGDRRADFAVLAAFFEGAQGKHPGKSAPLQTDW